MSGLSVSTYGAPLAAGRPPAGPAGLRIYAVGDIHGRLDLIVEMADMIDADAAAHPDRRPVEILVGDLIDRGTGSAGVVDFVIARKAERDLTVLRGNHEQYMLDALAGETTIARWMQFGGEAALASYGIAARGRSGALRPVGEIAADVRSRLPEAHLALFGGVADWARHGDYLFVHAGIRPSVPLEAQSPIDLVMIREGFLDDGTDHGFVVVHGHTPVARPEVRSNRIGIDTKAYESGRLTCLVIDGSERRFMQTG